MYDTVEEAQQKLANSTVLFDGKPVQVYQARGGKNHVTLEFAFFPFKGGSSPHIVKEPIDNPLWDFKSLGSKLGYVNIDRSPFDLKTEAVFVTRIPARTSRQGIDARTSKVYQFIQEYPYNWDHLQTVPGFVSCINNTYPTAKEAITSLVSDPENIKSVAIARKLMMIYDKVNPPNLIYRNEKVGYSEDGETFKLAAHKRFLAEELEDMFNLKIA